MTVQALPSQRETILVTGSSGLIGVVLRRKCAERDIATVGIDVRAVEPDFRIDIREFAKVAPTLAGITGIIHLAAVSRVIHGERNPKLCRQVNVDATRTLLQMSLRQARRPWFIYASSREVYGTQDTLPVSEDAPYRPVNVYGQSKVEAEELVNQARDAGLVTAVVRFSNVYGSANDHADRVVPAFVTAALSGGLLRVDGYHCLFDLSHVTDVAEGVLRVADRLGNGERKLPPIHFVSGLGTTLLELATTTNAICGNSGRIVAAASRTFDVHRFTGDPARAKAELGWEASTGLSSGLAQLALEFKKQVPL